MRSGGWALPILFLLLGDVVGCAQPTRPTVAPLAPGPPQVTLHGMIDLTDPNALGPQGARPPHFLHVDDGRTLGLILSPDSAILGDAASDGRGVTITGTLEPIVVEPLGPIWNGIVVTAFTFDTP